MSYVFDDKMNFIGDFDHLYMKEKSPWEQDGQGARLKNYYAQSRKRLSQVISQYRGFVVEVGCGEGHALNYLATINDSRSFVGVDISPTAIERAKKLYPHLSFAVKDITYEKVDAPIVILNECLWYVMHKMDEVMANIQADTILISQGFLREQRYGREFIDGWEGLLRYLLNNGHRILFAEIDRDGEPLQHGLVVCTRMK